MFTEHVFSTRMLRRVSWALLLYGTVKRSEIVPRWRTYFVCELFSIEDVLEPNKSSLMNAYASWAWDSELLMCHLGDSVLLCCRDELQHYHSFLSTSSTLYSPPPWDDVTFYLQTDEEDADLLGVRNRQVFFNDFSLPLPPPLTYASEGSGLGQLLTFIFPPPPLPPSPFLHPFLLLLCLYSLVLFPNFFYTHSHCLPPFPLSRPHSSCDCYDCWAFLCHGLQEEWVSTCQRAQVCTVDTGWLIHWLLERGGRCLHARAAEQNLHISHKVMLKERARCNIKPEKVKCTKIYWTKHCLFFSETVGMMQIYYRAGSLV